MRIPIIALLLSFLTAMSLSACNTVEGVGEDVQSLGRETEDAAEEAH